MSDSLSKAEPLPPEVLEKLKTIGCLHGDAMLWEDEVAEVRKFMPALIAAAERVQELEATFDLQWHADQRAIKRWQEAHPDKPCVWPDRADMVVWLMGELDTKEKRIAELEAALHVALKEAFTGRSECFCCEDAAEALEKALKGGAK